MIQINKKQMQVLFKKVIVITFIYSFLILNSFLPVFSQITPTCNGLSAVCPSGTNPQCTNGRTGRAECRQFPWGLTPGCNTGTSFYPEDVTCTTSQCANQCGPLCCNAGETCSILAGCTVYDPIFCPKPGPIYKCIATSSSTSSTSSTTSSTSSTSSTTGGICQITKAYCLNDQKFCCDGAQPTCPGGFFTCTPTSRGIFLECCINGNCTSQNVVCGGSTTSSGSGCINCPQVLPVCAPGEILVPQTCNKCAHCIPDPNSSSSTTGGNPICQITKAYCSNNQKFCCNGTQPSCPGGFFLCASTSKGSILECCINGDCSSQNVVCGSSTSSSSSGGSCITCGSKCCNQGEVCKQTLAPCPLCVAPFCDCDPKNNYQYTCAPSSSSSGSSCSKCGDTCCKQGETCTVFPCAEICQRGACPCVPTYRCDPINTSSSSSSSGGSSCIICPAIQPTCAPGEILVPQTCNQCAYCKPDPSSVNPVCELFPAFCSNGSRFCCNGAQPTCPSGFFTCTPTLKGSILECCINGNCTPQNVVCNSN